jgi:hypothetical protein
MAAAFHTAGAQRARTSGDDPREDGPSLIGERVTGAGVLRCQPETLLSGARLTGLSGAVNGRRNAKVAL